MGNLPFGLNADRCGHLSEGCLLRLRNLCDTHTRVWQHFAAVASFDNVMFCDARGVSRSMVVWKKTKVICL